MRPQQAKLNNSLWHSHRQRRRERKRGREASFHSVWQVYVFVHMGGVMLQRRNHQCQTYQLSLFVSIASHRIENALKQMVTSSHASPALQVSWCYSHTHCSSGSLKSIEIFHSISNLYTQEGNSIGNMKPF